MGILSKIVSEPPRLRSVPVCVLVASLALASVTSPAAAQPRAEDRAVAESLFLEGRKLMDQKRFPEACRKLEESHRIDPAAGTLLNLAVCHEGEGKLATAWGEFRQSLSTAKREQRADREKLCADRIAAIEPRLSHLIVLVPPTSRVPGLVVKRNGATLGEAVWGSPIPADMGEDVIEAEAPGYQSWKTTVKIEEAKTATASVPPLTAAPVTTTPPASEVPSKPVAAYVLMGVGAAGLAVGTIFGLSALSKKSDSDNHCPNERCDSQGVSLNDDAKHSARIADFGFGLGVVALGAGAYLFFSNRGAPAESTPAPSVSFGVAPLPNGGAAAMRGSF